MPPEAPVVLPPDEGDTLFWPHLTSCYYVELYEAKDFVFVRNGNYTTSSTELHPKEKICDYEGQPSENKEGLQNNEDLKRDWMRLCKKDVIF